MGNAKLDIGGYIVLVKIIRHNWLVFPNIINGGNGKLQMAKMTLKKIVYIKPNKINKCSKR